MLNNWFSCGVEGGSHKLANQCRVLSARQLLPHVPTRNEQQTTNYEQKLLLKLKATVGKISPFMGMTSRDCCENCFLERSRSKVRTVRYDEATTKLRSYEARTEVEATTEATKLQSYEAS